MKASLYDKETICKEVTTNDKGETHIGKPAGDMPIPVYSPRNSVLPLRQWPASPEPEPPTLYPKPIILPEDPEKAGVAGGDVVLNVGEYSEKDKLVEPRATNQTETITEELSKTEEGPDATTAQLFDVSNPIKSDDNDGHMTRNFLKKVETSPGRLEHVVDVDNRSEAEEARDKVHEIPANAKFKRTATMVTNLIGVVSNDSTRSQRDSFKNAFVKKASVVGKVASMGKNRASRGISENAMITIDSCKLYEELKPLFVLMKIAGLFFIRPQGEALFQRKGLLKHVTGQQIYCMIIFFIMSINWFRSVLSFSNDETFGYVLFFKLLWCIFWYECASRSLFANVMWWKQKGGLQDLFITVEKSCYADGIIPYVSALRKTMLFVILGVILSCLCITGVFAYGFFGPPNIQLLFDTVILPLPSNIPYIVFYKGVLLAVIVWSVIVAGLSLAFYSIVCFILYKEFEYFVRTFGMKIGAEGEFEDDLQRFRIAHQNKSLLVLQADQCFKYYIANIYMSNSPLVCLLLYNLLDTKQDFLYRLMGMFWVAIVLFQTMVVSVAAIALNIQAHSPLSKVHALTTGQSSPERQLEVSMFLNRLTATDIGLTAWDMFVINKPTMLTIAGMILTYFFLLVQFRNPLQSEDELSKDCSCTMFDSLRNNITVLYDQLD